MSLSQGGEVSRSAVQVEYVAAGTVTSVSPSMGSVVGGSVVTLSGTGFAAGRTACKFGSGMAFAAEVLSSEEARCVAPAAARGAVDVARRPGGLRARGGGGAVGCNCLNIWFIAPKYSLD